MLKKYFSIVLIIFSASFFSFSQQSEQSGELESSVPALEQFHEVIYPIWHTAYPAKDYSALRSYSAAVDSLSAEIISAKLPGILRDKKEKWNEGLEAFKNAVDEYKAQSTGTDDQALLLAAEDLHSKYEMLVRVIRPVSKELDEFHKILYVIYHSYLPEKQFEKIISASDNLLEKAAAVSQMKISKKLEPKSEEIKSASAELLDSVKELNSIKEFTGEKEISMAVEKVHGKYQKLEALF